MLSAYPAIDKKDFYEAGKALQRAYVASTEATRWIDFKCTSQEIFIRQRRGIEHESQITEPVILEDEVCETVEDLEEEDEVIPLPLRVTHF